MSCSPWSWPSLQLSFAKINAPLLSRNSKVGSARKLVMPNAPSEGPMARTAILFGAEPVMMVPPIRMSSPVPTCIRVEIFNASAAEGVAVGVGDGLNVGVGVGVAVMTGVGVGDGGGVGVSKFTNICWLVPVMEELTVSVAVIVSSGNGRRNVAVKVPAPLVRVLFAGNVAWGSVLVK